MQKKTTLLLSALIVCLLGIGLVLTTGDSAGKDICKDKAGRAFAVTISDGNVSNDDIVGKLCDKITFTNKDKITREIAFGPHDDHVPYDGIGEKFLNKSQSFTIILNQTGKFHWHDHEHDEIEGYFTVSE
jgi:hypothetical protein